MKTSIKMIVTALALVSVNAFATGNQNYGQNVNYDVTGFTSSSAGTLAGAIGGTNTAGVSLSVAGASNQGQASAYVAPGRNNIQAGSQATNVSTAGGFNKSFGTGFGGYSAVSTGFTGASGATGFGGRDH